LGGGQSIFALTPNADIGFTRIADKGSRPRRAPFAGETYIGLTMKGRRIAFATATLTALHLLVFLRLAALRILNFGAGQLYTRGAAGRLC
jgi:hypothetical protein